MFRKSKKEQVEVVKIVHKCSFCKKKDSIGNAGKTYYCSNNVCAVKLYN